ncbi:ribonuclease J [Cetobacterium ceti]|uniref:Ribonuclease J n=1 Tax=Cetobacterium ceti TaxID=180163 RepID=A0A1T4NY62_9FUSO|nr:ribonuclease J [Cetobacterium ceti]SJZ84183.1 ribonuclease J [Cetobacterium ceti]
MDLKKEQVEKTVPKKVVRKKSPANNKQQKGTEDKKVTNTNTGEKEKKAKVFNKNRNNNKKKPFPKKTDSKPVKKPVEKVVEEVKEIEKVEVLENQNGVESKEEKMYVIPLGGLDEVGKNMTLVQYRDEIIAIDCGVTFPDDGLLGIDLVIPDFTYLENNKDKIKGLFITHGHEDHIGSVPYLYQKIDKSVPVFGGKLALALIKSKFENGDFSRELPKMKEVKGRSRIKVGKYFTIEFVRVTHSIADAFAVVVTTPAGVVMYTGDFKIDLTPVDGQGVDFYRLAQIGEQGVDLLLSDSTNSEIEGFTPSERTVGEAFKSEFARAKGRIIVAAFASHVHRLQQIVDIAHDYGRKIAIDGRSLVKVFDIASDLGYLKLPKDIMVSLSDVDKLKDNKVVILCTGTQGEPMAALSRIAKNIHKHTKIKEGDTVIISATPIPGNEKAVSNNINNLLKSDAEVVFKKLAGIHVSGHASKEEQKLMLNLIKPKHFMPVHGEFKMLKAHQETAIMTGIPKQNIIVAFNGNKIEVTKSSAKIKGKVTAGATLVDGLGVGDIGNVVIKDRQQLSQEGVVVIVFTINKETGKLISGPDIVTRGFIYSRGSEEIINEVTESIKEKLNGLGEMGVTDWGILKNSTKDIAAKFFYNKTKRTPVILPIIMEV